MSKKRTSLKMWIIILASGGIILAFQNCARISNSVWARQLVTNTTGK